jgi:luciferase family oxidoreductase group 1
VPLPPIYLLGSSDYSAQLAGHIGAAFSFAHHFADFDAAEAMRLYRGSFKPSVSHEKPFAILATHVVCADTDAEAERLASTVDLNFVRRAKGEFQPLSSPDEAAAYDYTPIDRARIARNRERVAVGSPATVKAKLAPLIGRTKADELMVTSMLFDHTARKRSYELLAEVFA